MSTHTCHPGHVGVLADNCERCSEHAENPFAGLDQAKLEALTLLATASDRLVSAKTYADLRASKLILDAIDHVGKLLEAAPDLVVADLRKRWRAPIYLGREV